MLEFNQLYENNIPKHIEDERDKILDKISKDGIKSLSDYENRFLNSFKDKSYQEVYDKERENELIEHLDFKFKIEKVERYDIDREEVSLKVYGRIYIEIDEDEEQYFDGYFVVLDNGIIETFFNDGEDEELVIDLGLISNYYDFLHSIAVEAEI